MRKKNMPEAFIAVGKNRQKVFGGNTIYLEDKQEFEFEFFNPTSDNIMVKISINGKLISDRGVILRPGMRGWLERYIEENRKFLFETYEVEGESKSVKKAIQNNGDVKIEFYKEKSIKRDFYTPLKLYPRVWEDWSKIRYNDTHSGGYVNARATSDFTTYDSNNSNSCLYSSTIDFVDAEDGAGHLDGVRGFTASSSQDSKTRSKSLKKETGRVEKGSRSSQDFNLVDMDFELLSFHTVNYKILPVSEKHQDLSKIQLKCGNCGTKVKSGWKVCPVCATPISKDSYCTECGAKIESTWKYCPSCSAKI